MKEKVVVKILRQFGFTEPQARLYYAGLVKGPSLMAHLAQSSKIPRGTAYFLMKELQRRGFFTTKKHGRRTIYVAAPGERLLQLVREREKLVRKLMHHVNHL